MFLNRPLIIATFFVILFTILYYPRVCLSFTKASFESPSLGFEEIEDDKRDK